VDCLAWRRRIPMLRAVEERTGDIAHLEARPQYFAFCSLCQVLFAFSSSLTGAPAPPACRAHCPFVRIVCHPSTGYPARSGGSACDSPRWHGFFLARPPSFARRRRALPAPSNRRDLSSRLRHSKLLPSNRLSQRLHQPRSRPKPKSQPPDLPLLNLPITPFCSWCKATTNLGTCASA
jgi:hypothetical protein